MEIRIRERFRAIWQRIRSYVTWGVRIGFAVMFVGAMYAYWYLYWNRSNMPNVRPFIAFDQPTTGEIYDARGVELIELAKEFRRVVQYDEIPAPMREALLSAEDKNFFSHGGVDYAAFPRVLLKTLAHTFTATSHASDMKHGFKLVVVLPQGGSTLTQQLVRGFFLQDLTRKEKQERNNWLKIKRKIEEIRYSFWLEEELAKQYGSKQKAKEAIFERYASYVYLGGGRYGFAAASEYYFGKTLVQLTYPEAAMLASITKSPREYAPDSKTPKPLKRRNSIIVLMGKNDYLTPQQVETFQQESVEVMSRDPFKTMAPAVVNRTLNELRARGSKDTSLDQLFEGRIQVIVTTDKRIQQIANEAMEHGVIAYEQGDGLMVPPHPQAKGLVQGALIMYHNSDGSILAEIGGRQRFKNRNYTYYDFSRVDARRQPGSSFKPFVYLTALMNGQTLDTVVLDSPVAVKMGGGKLHWIRNYDNKFKGAIPLRQALGESRNASTTRICQEVGIKEVIKTAMMLGIQTPLKPEPSTALGASEVTLRELGNAYRAIASGLLAEPHQIKKISTANGTVIYSFTKKSQPVPIDAATLDMMREGLRGGIRLPEGTAHLTLGDPKKMSIKVFGKTGTTTQFKDAAFCGSTYGPKGITICVRFGFDNPGIGYDAKTGSWGNGPGRGLGDKMTGARVAATVFREIMNKVYTKEILGTPPQFPPALESHIDQYLGVGTQ